MLSVGGRQRHTGKGRPAAFLHTPLIRLSNPLKATQMKS